MSLDSAFQTLHSAIGVWLPDMDLNHDKQIQSLLCYRYTIGQTGGVKVGFSRKESSRGFNHQTSNSKLQRSFISQAPRRATEILLKFGIWRFSEVWCLNFGAFF